MIVMILRSCLGGLAIGVAGAIISFYVCAFHSRFMPHVISDAMNMPFANSSSSDHLVRTIQ